MALITNGSDVLFTISTTSDGTYTAVGASTTCTFTLNNALVDITSRDSGGAIDRASGRVDWSVTSDNFLRWDDESSETAHSHDELLDFQIAGTALFIHIGVGADIYTGQVMIDTSSFTGEADQPGTGSVSFVSKGLLTKAFAA